MTKCTQAVTSKQQGGKQYCGRMFTGDKNQTNSENLEEKGE